MGLVAPRHVGSSWTRARTRVPCVGRRILNHCATREAPELAFLKPQTTLTLNDLKQFSQQLGWAQLGLSAERGQADLSHLGRGVGKGGVAGWLAGWLAVGRGALPVGPLIL